MKLAKMLVCASVLLGVVPVWAQPKAMFYMGDGAAALHSFEEHKDKIDFLVPTWYSVNGDGLVAGNANDQVLRDAKAAHIAVLPIVALFNKEQAHKLVGDAKAQAVMNASLLRMCKENGYQGIQFDIEDISWTDKDGLTQLVKTTADLLHAQGLQVQIAVVPNAPGYPGKGDFSRWIFEDWRGAYDLKALGQAVDLLCLMTYDQHTRWTMPGPVAGWGWVTQNLNYALQYVPKDKLSLGIALYGYHWYTGDPGLGKPEQKPDHGAEYISAPNAQYLRDTFGAQQQWDPVDRTAWFWFYRDQMREWVFYTDKQTFAARYDLVKDQGLEGFCSWVLGEEDPAIWTVLPARKL